ncbi:MAG: hypothetical protein IPP14_06270 [Planctomycetes bacterium]|nr:hypothetical protein [Planctomycetota bacterium]
MSATSLCRRASITLVLLLATGGTLGGCASAGNYVAKPVAPAALPAYELQATLLSDPTHDADGYDVSLGFELRASDEFDYNAVVQEIVQEAVYIRTDGREFHETLSLVESFKLRRVGRDEDGRILYRLPSFQRDRHFERGYLSVGPMIKSIDVWRVVRYYPAYVDGADWTDLGFAHLPQTRNGALKTVIPGNFNESHQRSHRIQGRIVQDDRQSERWYHMRYHWYREPTGNRPQADFEFVNGARPGDESDWVSNTIKNNNRSANAGE